MVTSGLVFVRCRGRYFVYFNLSDSYPEELGKAIISKILADPVKYREWLESMRKTYSRLCQQFEEHHLPVQAVKGEDEIGPLVAERNTRSYLALDDRLECPPVQTLFQADISVQWTYTIDLDRELLGVNDSVFFALAKAPYVECRYMLFDERTQRLCEDTPEDIIGTVIRKPEIDSQARARYGEFTVKVVSPKAAIKTDGILHSPHHHLLLTAFQPFCYNYLLLLERHILRWNPDCFSFREIAFLVLSLAAGEVAFERKETLDQNHVSEGYFLIPDERIQGSQQKLLPKFLSEIHLPGKEPGSAPIGTSFWLGNVLVYLASRLDLVEVEEASVAKAVGTGISQGLKSFFSVVFSIIDFVLIQARVDEDGRVHVQRSPLMNLFYFCDENSHFADGPRSRKPQFDRDRTIASDSKERLEIDSQDDNRAFVALMHFFDAAANHNLMGAKSKVFPNEILAAIMQLSDNQTYCALAKASACCRDMKCHRFRLNNDYAIVGIDTNRKRGKWIIEDRQTGEKMHTSIHHFARRDKDAIEVVPVIGAADTGRQSIMDIMTLRILGVRPKDPPYTKKIIRPPRQRSSRLYRRHREDLYHMFFNIPQHAYPGFVEVAWSRYIDDIKQRYGCPFFDIKNVSFPCLLPHHQRRLRLIATTEAVVVIRKDNKENPEGWEEAERNIIQELSEEGTAVRSQCCGIPGRMVILAFGTKVKVFYYVPYMENPPPFEPNPDYEYSSQTFASFTDPDPANRLIQLIPGSGPSDICDKDIREKFEYWINALHGTIFFLNKTVDKEVDLTTGGPEPGEG